MSETITDGRAFIVDNDADINMTHFQGEFTAAYADLEAVLGAPGEGDGYKVQGNWTIRFADGTLATIYDWKEGDAYNGAGKGTPLALVTEWYVGGHTTAALRRVEDEILPRLADSRRNEARAEARLNAAAPELLAAARFAEMTLADFPVSARKGYVEKANAMLRAAIAKAECGQ